MTAVTSKTDYRLTEESKMIRGRRTEEVGRDVVDCREKFTICARCGERKKYGTPIMKVADFGWVHEKCTEHAWEAQRPACPTCWLELPSSGVCGSGCND